MSSPPSYMKYDSEMLRYITSNPQQLCNGHDALKLKFRQIY
jgi:hypothetical protein